MCGLLCPVPIIVPTLSEYTYGAAATAGCNAKIITVVDDKQQGFTKTANRGIKLALEENPGYIAILNDDAYPVGKWLQSMIEAMSRMPGAGLAGPSGLCGTLPQAFGVPHMDYDAHYVRQLAFFCVVIKTKVFNDIGLMNEEFTHYGSDNDFVLRAEQSGWRSIWVQHVYVPHDHKTSESAVTARWKKHDKKILAEKWPDLVHGSIRKLRRPQRPSRRLARMVTDRLQRQGVANR